MNLVQKPRCTSKRLEGTIGRPRQESVAIGRTNCLNSRSKQTNGAYYTRSYSPPAAYKNKVWQICQITGINKERAGACAGSSGLDIAGPAG